MIERLRELLNNSRSDYFNYPVSCCIKTNDGREFYGVNVETSSPAAGICAERNALYSSITCGVNPKDITEVHVMSRTGGFPCFICRQALSDYLNKETKVFVYDMNSLKEESDISSLTPKAFGKGDL